MREREGAGIDDFVGHTGTALSVCWLGSCLVWVCVSDPSAGLFLWRDPGMKTSSVDLLRSCLCFQTAIYSVMNAQCVCVFCECTFHECVTNSGWAAVGHSLLFPYMVRLLQSCSPLLVELDHICWMLPHSQDHSVIYLSIYLSNNKKETKWEIRVISVAQSI